MNEKVSFRPSAGSGSEDTEKKSSTLPRSVTIDHRALFTACASEDAEAISAHLKQYENLDCQDQEGQTLLMATCAHGSRGMVRQLLQYGADPNVRDQHGVDALSFAISSCSSHGNPEDPERSCSSHGNPEDPELVAWLLEFGALPDTADSMGTTPLHRACASNQVLTAELLLNAGADPRRVNAAGDAALSIVQKLASDAGNAANMSQLHGMRIHRMLRTSALASIHD